MKQLIKKIASLTLVVVVAATLLTGCKSQDEKTLFSFAGNDVTYQEAHVYARIQQYSAEEQYASYFGDKMWSTQVGTDDDGKKITLQQSIKTSVIEQIKQVKVLCAHAKDYDVKLTSAEKKQLNTSMSEFAKNDLGKKVMKVTGADKAFIKEIYRENMIASKVQSAIIEKAKVTVSDAEATTINVYKLVFTTKKTDSKTGKSTNMTAKEKKAQLEKAQKALKEINGGTNIKTVAKKYGVNTDNSESYTAGKSALGTKFEAAVKKLKKNQVSGVIETKNAYVIVKFLSTSTKDLATTKSTLLSEKQQEAYNKVYEKWTKKATKAWDEEKDVDQDLWKQIKFKYEATTTASTGAASTEGTTTATTEATTASK